MSFRDWIRWQVLDFAACYHGLICGARAASATPQTQWLHDRPDWFVKFVVLNPPKTDIAIYIRMHRQAQIELDFRRATGVTK